MKSIILALFLVFSLPSYGTTSDPGGVVNADNQSRGPLTVISATIATGGVSQTALASETFRKYVLIQNPSTAGESLFLNFGASAASATTLELTPGQSIVFETLFMSTDQINVFAATTAHPYTILVGY